MADNVTPTEVPMMINGHNLTQAQAMTVRCALNAFLMEMSEPNALGDDEHGLKMTAAYRERASEVLRIIMVPAVSNGDGK